MASPEPASRQRPSRSIDWLDVFPWLIIIRALRPAISFRVLFLSAAGLLATIAGWRIFWRFFVPSREDILTADADPVLRSLAMQMPEGRAWPAWPWQAVQSDVQLIESVTAGNVSIVILTNERLTNFITPFRLLFARDLTWVSFAFVVLCVLWALLIWSYFGGMITRAVALRLTQDEVPSWKRLSSFVRGRLPSYFGAPIYPFLGVALATVPVAILGLFIRADIGALVAAIVWPLAILAGLFITILLVGLVFGWPLMFSTISVEGTDAFDALGRAYAYVYQRPLHYLFYAIVAVVFGVIGWIFVELFAATVLHCTYWAASWGAGERIYTAIDDGFTSSIGSFASALLMAWHHGVLLLASGFVIGYFWSASTAIYLLLRRQVDAAEMDEVEMDEQDDLYGLPDLESESAKDRDLQDGSTD